MANDKKADQGAKNPPKVETVNLKVFIHCEGCKKKVKKTLNSIEGVYTVDVDGSSGKVTVTGTVDSKVLVKKLEKAGKVAEVIPNGGGGGGKDKEQKDQQQKGDNKENNNEANKENQKKSKGGNGGDGGDGENKAVKGNNNDGNAKNNNNKGNNNDNQNNSNGEGGKKKKKGNGGENANNSNSDDFENFIPNSKNVANRNVAPIMVQTGYSSLESADYATHMFSDENANNCSIM